MVRLRIQFVCLLQEMTKCRVTSLSLLLGTFPGFSTESSVSWETPQSQASQRGWSHFVVEVGSPYKIQGTKLNLHYR